MFFFDSTENTTLFHQDRQKEQGKSKNDCLGRLTPAGSSVDEEVDEENETTMNEQNQRTPPFAQEQPFVTDTRVCLSGDTNTDTNANNTTSSKIAGWNVPWWTTTPTTTETPTVESPSQQPPVVVQRSSWTWATSMANFVQQSAIAVANEIARLEEMEDEQHHLRQQQHQEQAVAASNNINNNNNNNNNNQDAHPHTPLQITGTENACHLPHPPQSLLVAIDNKNYNSENENYVQRCLQRIALLSQDVRTFLDHHNTNSSFNSDYNTDNNDYSQEVLDWIQRMVHADLHLEGMYAELVPEQVSDERFWQNYLFHCRRVARDEWMTQQQQQQQQDNDNDNKNNNDTLQSSPTSKTNDENLCNETTCLGDANGRHDENINHDDDDDDDDVDDDALELVHDDDDDDDGRNDIDQTKTTTKSDHFDKDSECDNDDEIGVDDEDDASFVHVHVGQQQEQIGASTAVAAASTTLAKTITIPSPPRSFNSVASMESYESMVVIGHHNQQQQQQHTTRTF